MRLKLDEKLPCRIGGGFTVGADMAPAAGLETGWLESPIRFAAKPIR